MTFEDDQHKRRLGAALPVLPTKPGQKLPHQSIFLSPFVQALYLHFTYLTGDIDKAFVQHTGKEMMKIPEDPWDNYLYFDSRYVLPIICHSTDLPIEQQALLSIFIQKSIEDESIS